jgi:hypothetical protein
LYLGDEVMAIATPSGPAQSRFAAGAEWLARRLDWQRRTQELAEQNEGESVTLQSVLADRGQQSKPEEQGQKPYGIENVYKVYLHDPELGLSFRATVYGYGTILPMTEADKQAHFLRQIEAAIIAARQGN